MDLFSANQLMWAAFIIGNSAPLLFFTLYKTQKILHHYYSLHYIKHKKYQENFSIYIFLEC